MPVWKGCTVCHSLMIIKLMSETTSPCCKSQSDLRMIEKQALDRLSFLSIELFHLFRLWIRLVEQSEKAQGGKMLSSAIPPL